MTDTIPNTLLDNEPVDTSSLLVTNIEPIEEDDFVPQPIEAWRLLQRTPAETCFHVILPLGIAAWVLYMFFGVILPYAQEQPQLSQPHSQMTTTNIK